ncbi:hypothetical protein [Paracidovorax valerianellae]|uniref:Uncharacterized protein n=1 Tax=Paracidovorax valerianellae TaxID=187868 RepID=A0A1G7CJQ4_9BURK|nr:hypothetical protein [Paracidovorax valerianellae]MDA8443819.1 hypothetical protein [Paracidovorax valerianellae]SDE39588.1 hypothetical protein SAMN05192589_11679 [Paracidovorax valerianellae]
MKTNANAAQPAALPPALPTALRDAVEAVYAAFQSHCAPKQTLDVCTACCMDGALEREMRRLPLRQVTTRHFYEYNSSAKSSEQPAEELLYLLPRMLELLAQGEALHHSTELYLERLGRCEAGALSRPERAAVDAFALALFREGLGHSARQASPFNGSNAFDVLLMFHKGGVSIAPLLAHWLEDDRPSAVLHYADSSYWDFWGKQRIQNAFSTDEPEFQKTMNDWLVDAGNRQRFSRKILAIDAEFPEDPKPCTCGTHLGPQQILEAVFDVISE